MASVGLSVDPAKDYKIKIDHLYCRYLFKPGDFYTYYNSWQWDTVCPRSSYPFYMVSYYIKWVTTSWTHSTICPRSSDPFYRVTYCIKCITASRTEGAIDGNKVIWAKKYILSYNDRSLFYLICEVRKAGAGTYSVAHGARWIIE